MDNLVERKVCPFYLTGTCRQMATCKWLHPAGVDVPAPKTSSIPYGMPETNEAKVCPYYPLGKCSLGNGCKWIHPGQPFQICPHYSVGKCYYGTTCKFKHLGPAPIQLGYPTYGLPSFPTPHHFPIPKMNVSMGHQGPVNPKPCKFFQEGNCPYENCKFVHVGVNEFIGSGFPQEDTTGKVCRFWQSGHCHFEHCKYAHIGPAGQGAGLDTSLKRPGGSQEEDQSVMKRARVEPYAINDIRSQQVPQYL